MPKRCRRISDTSEMIEWFGMDYLIQRIYADLFQMSTVLIASILIHFAEKCIVTRSVVWLF